MNEARRPYVSCHMVPRVAVRSKLPRDRPHPGGSLEAEMTQRYAHATDLKSATGKLGN
jgi:hypothetical protein